MEQWGGAEVEDCGVAGCGVVVETITDGFFELKGKVSFITYQKFFFFLLYFKFSTHRKDCENISFNQWQL